MNWELIYAIAWWVVAAFAVVVLPVLLASKTRSVNHQYRGRRRARS